MKNIIFLKLIPRIFGKRRFYRTSSLYRSVLKPSFSMRVKQFQIVRGIRELGEVGHATNSGTWFKNIIIFQVGKNKLKKTRTHWIGIP